MGQTGFFDVERRLEAISAKGDRLETIKKIVPWEDFRTDIEATFLPVPELLGGEGEAVGAERQPRQREFDRGRGANDRRGGNAECAGGAGDAGEPEERPSMECHIAVSY